MFTEKTIHANSYFGNLVMPVYVISINECNVKKMLLP